MSLDFLKRLFGLEGVVAVVVGDADGVGGRVSETLVRAGATLVLADDSMSRGYRRVDVLRALSGHVGFRRVDASRLESLSGLWEYVLGEHGRVDVVFVCPPSEPDHAATPNANETSWRAVWWFAQEMANQVSGGSIVLVASDRRPEGAADIARRDATRSPARQRRTGKVRINLLSATASAPMEAAVLLFASATAGAGLNGQFLAIESRST